ncbi:MAG TPA: DNA internalization-related competence protein ComEC/Rec2, partial [Candidatus Hydrogenedentes bacterium]|nr:DNA internalization-related competence protein ComEC/Rec2 [Candidatus Hydrogenedentota bacterium]
SHGGLERLGVSWWSPYYWASRMRVWEANVFRRTVPESALPLLYTIWLGDSGQISGEPYNAYVRSGTAHVLAVSGIHVGIVYLSVGFVLSIFLRNRRLRSTTMIAVLILFALTAGARVACLRATFMVVVYLAADLVDREPDTPTALSLSAVLLLLINPANIFDTGFVLSFASVASILLFMERIAELLAALPWILRSNIAMTVGAQLLTIPLVAFYFHVFTPIGFLVNLVMIPLLTGTLWLCFFTVAAAGLMPPAAVLFGHAIQPLAYLMQRTAEEAARIPFGHLDLTRPSPLAALLYWTAMAALFAALGKGTYWRRWTAAAVVLLLLAFALWKPWHLPASVDFLDVGHSDAAFVRTPAGATLLIDGGDKTSYSDMGAKAVIPFLYANGVTRLDYVIVSHPESDHIGGLLTVVRTMPVGKVVLGPAPSTKQLEKDFLEACADRNVPVQRVSVGDTIPVEGADIHVLHPPPEWPQDKLNEASLVVRMSWPGVSILFAGDIEKAAEVEVAQQECQALVLKVPHHGSLSSSTSEFIDAVNPAYAVISTNSAGRGKPADSLVLRRYEKRGISVLRTDYWGGIRLREENGRWILSGARLARGYSLEPVIY